MNVSELRCDIYPAPAALVYSATRSIWQTHFHNLQRTLLTEPPYSLSFFGMLVYAIIIFMKHRKGTLGGATGGYKPTQQNDVHGFDSNIAYGHHPAQQYPSAPYAPQPYAPQDYSYGGAQKPQDYQQQPQYGYAPQQGVESHEMHHQRV